MPSSWNVELLGYSDLDGHSGFKLAMHETDGRMLLYVASLWESGWSIVDVTEPSRPQYLRWLAGPANTWTIQLQVAEDLMITALEAIPPGWSAAAGSDSPPATGFAIWSLAQPEDPTVVGQWESGGSGAHRNFYNGGRYVHTATNLPGFDGQLYGVVDIEDPEHPELRGTWWYPGQRRAAGEVYSEADRDRLAVGRPYPTANAPMHGLSLHGAAYVFGQRAYCPWMRGGLVILDTTDATDPKLVSTLAVHPPLGSTIAVHSAVPYTGRPIVVINSEALHEDQAEPVAFAGVVDVSDEQDPILVSLFPQPRAPQGSVAFHARGGRFGPHNQHQHQGMNCLASNDDLVYMTYFAGGLQIYDIADHLDPHIVGYYVPDDPTSRLGPYPRALVHQAEDVLVDRRGVIYMSEKNTGVYIMGFER